NWDGHGHWDGHGDRGHWNGHHWNGGGWRGYYPYYGSYGYYDPWAWGGVGFGIGATLSSPYYYGGYDTYYDDYSDAPLPPADYGCDGWQWDPAAQQYFWGRVAC